MPNLYDKDFPAWAEETAHLLTQRRFEEVDLEALIDEVLDLSRSEKRAVKSFMETIIEHLLKLTYAPTPIYENNVRGWTQSVKRTRRQLGERLSESRLLSNYAAETLEDAYTGALYDTTISTDDFGPVDWPNASPWSLDQVLDPDFFPSREQG